MGCLESTLSFLSQRRHSDEVDRSDERPVEITHVDASHFTQGKLLGIGAFSVVKEATHLVSGATYAIKITSKSKAIDANKSGNAHQLIGELRALAWCKSPFIANMHWAFQDDTFLYIVLDYGCNGDLRQLANRNGGRLKEHIARFYIAQVMLAVGYCHSQGVLHRDIKPENIVLNDRGYAMLTDFGISRIPNDIRSCRATSGTHGFMPPEVYKSPNIHGPPADWFAVGVCLHELVLGCKPYSREELEQARGCPQETPVILRPLSVCSSLVFPHSNSTDMGKTAALLSILEGLLAAQPTRRLGTNGGLKELQRHTWLSTVQWQELQLGSVPVPTLMVNEHCHRSPLHLPLSSMSLLLHPHSLLFDTSAQQVKHRGVTHERDFRLAHTMLQPHPLPVHLQASFRFFKYRNDAYTPVEVPTRRPFPGPQSHRFVLADKITSNYSHEMIMHAHTAKPMGIYGDGDNYNERKGIVTPITYPQDNKLHLHSGTDMENEDKRSDSFISIYRNYQMPAEQTLHQVVHAQKKKQHLHQPLGKWCHCNFRNKPSGDIAATNVSI